MDDNPQTTTSEVPQPVAAPQAVAPAAAPDPMNPPMASPMAAYPTAGGISQDEKTQAMLMWILSIFIYFISPLIFYLIGKEKPYVYVQAARGLAFQLVLLIAWVAAGFLTFILIGFLLFPIIGILNLIVCIMGAIAASKGEDFSPPMTGGLAKSWFKV